MCLQLLTLIEPSTYNNYFIPQKLTKQQNILRALFYKTAYTAFEPFL